MAEEVLRKEYLDILTQYRDIDLIKVITGMRRTGKSTLMRQFITVLRQEGIRQEQIIYIDMDSMENDSYRDDPKLLYGRISSKKDAGRLYIFIDEVQNIRGWEHMVESVRNDMDCDLYITGSNSYMLSSEISTLLTGRSVTITMLPLSLKEVCTFSRGQDPKTVFLGYLRHGGLPIIRPDYSEEVIFQIIDELKSDIILKDICNRKAGTDPVKIRKVIDYLYSEVGNPISVKSISEKLGISLATVTEYMQMILDSMLFIRVDRYDLKGRSVLSQSPKYYCTDLGMRYSQPLASGRDFGKTLENIVFLELMRRGFRVYVGKTRSNDDEDRHLEIDFIVMKDDCNDYYQVTESLSDPSVSEREFRPLRKVTGRGERYVLTYDDRPVSRSSDAVVMNIVDFLMDGRQDDIEPAKAAVYSELYDRLMEYIAVCRNISGTVVTRDNFDQLSDSLQSRFFDLQAYFGRPGLIDDGFLQSFVPRIRKNNVRIFQAMIACVNSNKEPMYKPWISDEMEELTAISKDISRHLSKRGYV